MKIDLPDGGWAELKDLSELKAKDKIAVQRAITFVPDPSGKPTRLDAGMTEDMQMALLSRIIKEWSLTPPAPVTVAVLEELPIGVYNALSEAVEDYMEVVRVVPNRRTPPA